MGIGNQYEFTGAYKANELKWKTLHPSTGFDMRKASSVYKLLLLRKLGQQEPCLVVWNTKVWGFKACEIQEMESTVYRKIGKWRKQGMTETEIKKTCHSTP